MQTARLLRTRTTIAAALTILAATVLVAGLTTVSPPPAQAVSNQPGLPAMRTNVFYAYVKAGERVDAYASERTVRVTNPLGATTTGNSIRAAVAVDGIWTIAVERGATNDDPYRWRVDVLSGSVVKPGRVWFGVHTTNQADLVNLKYWAVNANGYMYTIEMNNYVGAYGRIMADAVGVSLPGTCVPAYKSREFSGLTMQGHFPALQDCGSSFKIFFEEPDPILPVQAQIAPGRTEWIIPPPVTPESIHVTDFSFTPTTVKSAAGTFTYSMSGFAGNYLLQVDVNDNGSYTDPVDRTLPLGGAAVTAATVAFDGIDGLGQAIPDGTIMMARVWFERTGEMHIVMDDVEARPSLRVTRINGPGAPDYTIYWDDSALSTVNRTSSPPVMDGTAGVSSENFAHGWQWAEDSPWGNDRRVDDWVYGPLLDHTGSEIQIGVAGVLSTKEASPSTGVAVLPGQTVRYTLTFTASSRVAVEVETTDDLSGILDDATLVGAIEVSDSGLTVGPPDPDGIVAISGTIPRGQTTTITYAVQVKPFVDGGNHRLTGTLGCDIRQDACVPRTTNHPVAHLTGDLTATVPGGQLALGADVALAFTATNDGQAPLTDLTIVSEEFDGAGAAPQFTCSPGAASVGADVTCTATYPVTQADVDRGSLTATVHATGLTAPGPEADDASQLVVSNTDSDSLSSTARPALALSQAVVGLDPDAALVGQEVTYEFEVTNSGDVTAAGVAIVEDTFTGAGSVSAVTCPAPAVNLAPGASVVCQATYRIAQPDVDAGFVSNTAHATAAAPDQTAVTSPHATARLDLLQQPGLGLTKVSSITDPTQFVVGAAATFTYTVTNTGNTTMTALEIVEQEFTGTGPLSTPTCQVNRLVPGATGVCTTTYVITQGDVDAGELSNSARVRGRGPSTDTEPTGLPVESAVARAVARGDRVPAAVLDKAVTGFDSTAPALGQMLTYQFVVTNTGNVTLRDIGIDEVAFSGSGRLGHAICPATPAQLSPGQDIECSATYEITQADVDAGQVTNTATAHATAATGAIITTAPDHATVVLPQHPAIGLVKSVTGLDASAPLVGQVVTYLFDVTNRGDATVNDVIVVEDTFSGSGQVSAVECPAGASRLVPDTSVRCRATYVVTQADVDAGLVANTAHAVAIGPDAGSVVAGPSTARLDLVQAPALALSKSSSVADPTDFTVGHVVTYTYTVTNSGNTTLSHIDIVEQQFTGSGTLPAAACVSTTLVPGDSTLCTTTYVLTQLDIDAGGITNSARAHGQDPAGQVVTSASAQALSPGRHSPSVHLDQTVTGLGTDAPAAGQTITYHFAITNTGNVTLRSAAVADVAFSGTGTWMAPSCSPALDQLAPAASAECTVTYTITQTDADNGVITNTSTAQAITPTDTTVISPSDTTTLTLPQHSYISLTKRADTTALANPIAVGNTITYTFDLSNTGDVTIHDAAIQDPLPGLSLLSVTWPATPGLLLPGAHATATATYSLTQTDIDNGSITNAAGATAIAPDGTALTSPQSIVRVDLAQAPGLGLTKTSSITDPAQFVVGAPVTFTYTVTNTGNATIAGLEIVEQEFTGSGTLPAAACDARSLAPGATTLCTTTYTITQSDVDGGELTNSARVRGRGPATTTEPTGRPAESAVARAVSQGDQVPAAVLDLIVTGLDSTAPALGQTVTYHSLVTNVGNVTLQSVGIDEVAFSGSGPLGNAICPATPAQLSPGQDIECTTTYEITQADVDAGQITNTATAHATGPTGAAITTAPDNATVALPQHPAIGVVKTVSGLDPEAPLVGQGVTYEFAVTNTGDVTLANVDIAEDVFTGAGPGLTVSCPPIPNGLVPGLTTICRATYEVVQADVDAGFVTNTAHATGTAPDAAPVVSAGSTIRLDLPRHPALGLVKSMVGLDTLAPLVGQEVTYLFDVTNRGNATVSNIAIAEDAFSGSGQVSAVECPDGAARLAPDVSVRCRATYVVTQADVDAGFVTNTAHATGTGPDAASVVAGPSTTQVDLPRAPALALSKSSSIADPADFTVGHVVTYTYTVTNSGNTTLSHVDIIEQQFTGSGTLPAAICTSTTLVPGDSTLCSTAYVLTQLDIDAGRITNTARAHGQDPAGQVVTSASAEALSPGQHTPAIHVDQTITGFSTDTAAAGQAITYHYVITNTGNVTLRSAAVDDVTFSGTGSWIAPSCSSALDQLAPAASAECTTTYTITQTDADHGVITNTSTVHAVTPTDTTITSLPDTTTVTLPQNAHVNLTKQADTTALASPIIAGNTITYTFDLANTGDVTIHNAAIHDPLPGLGLLSMTWPAAPGILSPGAHATGTATYPLTQTDIDNESIVNTATASGLDPGGSPVSPPDPASVRVPLAPFGSLSVTPTVRLASAGPAGATDRLQIDTPTAVVFAYTVVNTGNITLTDVTLINDLYDGARLADPSVTLAPGQSTVIEAPYIVLQSDIDYGLVLNNSQATGTAPAGRAISSDPAEAVIVADHKPSASVSVTSSLTAAADYVVGRAVQYVVNVTNTGNVTLNNVAAEATAFTGSGPLSDLVCADRALGPGASLTCSADYQLTQADVDAAHVDLRVEATGASPGSRSTGGLPTTTIKAPPDDARITGSHAPRLSLVISSSLVEATEFVVDAAVTYTYVVTNEGNVTIGDIEIAQQTFTGGGVLSPVICPGRSLAPGQQMSCTATYTLTQADVDNGQLEYAAEVVGRAPIPAGGTTPSPLDRPRYSLSSPGIEDPVMTLVKTAKAPTEWLPGATIDYEFAVANIGNVTVLDLNINEVKFLGAGGPAPQVLCPATTLAPGESMTCRATYAVTDADLAGGVITNVAEATATTTLGTAVVSGESTAAVTIPAPLPKTGAQNSAAFAVVACLVMGLGLLFILLSRRRRHPEAAR